MAGFLSFDVGTTAMKCVLFDEEFGELFYTNKEYNISTKSGGIAELDAEVYFKTFSDCISDMLSCGVLPSDVASVTFTTQGETLIPIDKDGNALCPAIVWLDSRAGTEADFILKKVSFSEIYSKTGLGTIDGALPVAKLMWIKKNMPFVYERTYKFLLLEDYLIYRLTDKCVSEKSLQSSTGWYDIINDTYYDKMLDMCGVDKLKLPEVLPCGTLVGNISADVANKLGLSESTVIVTGAMDQVASAVGVGNIKEGMFTETTGTALVAGITVNSPDFDVDSPITVYKHYNDKYIYMPYCSTAGITLKWFRDKIMPYVIEEAKEKGISSYDCITECAAKSVPGSNDLIMLPKLSKKGSFIGLTLATSISDMARSVLEGVAYMLRDIVESVEAKGIKVKEIYSLGGGSYSPLWSQIKSDVCNKPIYAVHYAQTTALGAAILASVAVGKYKSVEIAVSVCNIKKKTFRPNLNNLDLYSKSYNNYKKYLSLMEVCNEKHG